MAINTGFQQQQPLGFSAAVRSTPSPQHAARIKPRSEPPVAPEQKSPDPRPER